MTLSSVKLVFMVLVLWLAGLGAAAQFAKIAVPFSSVRTLFPEAGADIGWLLSFISLLGIFFGMTAGIIVSRFGSIRSLILALVLGAAVSFWQATLPSLTPMLMSRLIEGASHLVIVVAAPTLIAQVSTDRYRGAAMTLWSTFFGVSFAVVAWIGLPFVDAYGLTGLFIAHGMFMMMVAGLMTVGYPALGVATPRSKTPMGFGRVLYQHVAAYRSPFVSAPAVGWFFYTLTFVALLAILPDLLPEQSRGQVATLMPLASIAVSLLVVSPMLAFLSATTIVVIGFVSASVVLSLFWVDLPASYIGVTLFAVLGMVQGASFAAVPELNHTFETRMLSNGAVAQMGNLGNTLGTPLLLMIQGHAGLAGLLLAVLASYAAGCVAHIFLACLRRG